MENLRQRLTKPKRWVVKIGSALLTNDGKGLNLTGIKNWVAQVSWLKKQGCEVIMVSSGSVAEGMVRLGFKSRPKTLPELQAAAAVGQMGLVQAYESCFLTHGLQTAQILLTHADLSDRQRYLNARSTLKTLVKFQAVPIVNENDTVVTDEIRFGDNDTLAALVANLVEADALILLTDQNGLYESDPRKDPDAPLVESAYADDTRLDAMAGGGGVLGRGGMTTKVRAARLAARSGALTVIADGRTPNLLGRLIEGENIGTLLIPKNEPITARKQWLAGHLQTRGSLVLDDGAVEKVLRHGKSVLPIGVREVRGNFRRGEMVECLGLNGQLVAKGLVNYSIEAARKIAGRPTKDIINILGYAEEPELVHRDNLVTLIEL